MVHEQCTQGSEMRIAVLMMAYLMNLASAADPADVDLLIDNAGLQIAGTLTLPPGATEYMPLVILISGSGAQERDSEVFGFPVLGELAEQLRQAGIASFRFDDRETGQSTGSFSDATLDRLVADVGVIVDHFMVFSEQKFAEIILVGHSQGGIVAGRLATIDTRVSRVVLLASTGMNLRRILRQQVTDAYMQADLPAALIEAEISAREEIMYAAVDGGDINAALIDYAIAYRQVLDTLPQSAREQIPDPDAFAANQATQLLDAFSDPQMQSLLFHDPLIDLEELDKPVLKVFGGKDTQVIESLNRPPMEFALQSAGADFKAVVIPEANHLFQAAVSGEVSEYPVLEKQFAEGFVDSIANWILGLEPAIAD